MERLGEMWMLMLGGQEGEVELTTLPSNYECSSRYYVIILRSCIRQKKTPPQRPLFADPSSHRTERTGASLVPITSAKIDALKTSARVRTVPVEAGKRQSKSQSFPGGNKRPKGVKKGL